MLKFANCDILDIRHSPEKVEAVEFEKLAKPTVNDDGFLYVQVRAISSRVNKNNDGWPSEELAKAYKTFEGRPIFIDHNNDDPERTRGYIKSALLHVEDLEKASAFDPYYATAPDNHKPPTWIELLLEVDAKAFPKLAKYIINGDIDSVSMGSNISLSRCSVCGTEAKNPLEYCTHIKDGKGQEFEITSAEGEKTKKMAYEDCEGVNFFEISFVFDPADDTALVQDIRSEANAKLAANGIGEPPPEEDDQQPAEPSTEEAEPEGLATQAPNRDNENERVIQWRLEQFEALGFPPDVAQGLANGNVDWHDIENMIGRGATPDQAHAIVAKKAESAIKKTVPVELRGGSTLATLASFDSEEDLEKLAVDGGGGYELNDHSERVINYIPQSEQTTAPQDVDTLRAEEKCKRCDSEMNMDKTVGAHICPECGWERPPVGLDSPDLSLHHRLEDGMEHDTDPPSALDPGPPPIEEGIGPESPVAPVSPVNAISRSQSDRVISEMKFTTKSRFVVEDKTTTIDKKVLLPDPNKKGTDEPKGTKIISDQLAPVETNKDAMDKEADRETIKRVEEDGQGTKRTEEIIREHGPMGDSGASDLGDGTNTMVPPPEGEVPGDDPLTPATNDVAATPSENPVEDKTEPDKPKWSSESALFAALKLAKFAAEIGIIDAKDELLFVGEIESESSEQIEARRDTLQRVKDAGLSKKRTVTSRRGFPTMPKASAVEEEDSEVPFEALFVS